jgi:hypothetical protein
MKLPRVYPIVETAEWVARLLLLGVRLVQLRIKDRTAVEVRSEIREARALCARAGAQLVVNDYWQLAMAEECDFAHLGQGDLDTADLPALRKAGIKIGISTHDHADSPSSPIILRSVRSIPLYSKSCPGPRRDSSESRSGSGGSESFRSWRSED